MPYPSHTQKVIAKVWTMPSSSNFCTYETLQFTDGSTSCNCPGWTRRITADGQRSCKHTRMVDMGTADVAATVFVDYQHFNGPTQQQQNKKDQHGKSKDGTPTVGKLGQRKLIL